MRTALLFVFLFLVCLEKKAEAAPRALPAGQLPDDQRLGPLRTLNSYFPFTEVASPEAWAERAESLRRQILVANGLWPLPSATPANAVVHGPVDRDGYTVEKVFFQSFPRHYVTGNLYRPKGKDGPHPAILSPHGHFKDGRFHDHGEAQLRKELDSGAEFHLAAGRHPLQARCAQLARMGCVVFHYDMVGYADSLQIGHRPGVRESMNTATDWGFFSPAAELRLQNMMGLQTYNSIRALDWVASLPDVDPDRIGVTGGSGGGTQTMILGAIDDRPAALFPAVMVSTAMQGGCTCENAPYLRIGAGNVDIAALSSPRPLGLTAADDWTKEIATKGQPALEKLYRMVGHPKRVSVAAYLHFGHNYNALARRAMYQFFNRHLKLGIEEPLVEKELVPLSRTEMSVWNATHPAPSDDEAGDTHERTLLSLMTLESERQIIASRTNPDTYRQMVGGGWRTILHRNPAHLGKIDFKLVEKEVTPVATIMTGLLSLKEPSEQLPALFLHPGDSWNGEVVLWVTGRGKSHLLKESGAPIVTAASLLEKGYSVMSVDVLKTGEFLKEDQQSPGATALVGKGDKQPWRRFAGYTFGYNHPLFIQRVHDVLSAAVFVGSNPDWKTRKVHLIGTGGLGPVVTAARSLLGNSIGRTLVDSEGFRFHKLTRFDDPSFVPGAVKYDDFPGLVSLCAPHHLSVRGETPASLALANDLYQKAGAGQQLTIEDGERSVDPWIVENLTNR
ncbi:MAG: acetylxylan esterase [Verrucomicrobiota bacterium]